MPSSALSGRPRYPSGSDLRLIRSFKASVVSAGRVSKKSDEPFSPFSSSEATRLRRRDTGCNFSPFLGGSSLKRVVLGPTSDFVEEMSEFASSGGSVTLSERRGGMSIRLAVQRDKECVRDSGGSGKGRGRSPCRVLYFSTFRTPRPRVLGIDAIASESNNQS